MARRSRILLVEDQSDDACLFSIGAQSSHPATGVYWVGDGQEAIDYLSGAGPFRDREKYPLPDLIVVDLRMHRINGLEFLGWLSRSSYSGIPAVIWTGSPDPKEIQTALALGAQGIFNKPVRFEELLHIIEQICDQGQRLKSGGHVHTAGLERGSDPPAPDARPLKPPDPPNFSSN